MRTSVRRRFRSLRPVVRAAAVPVVALLALGSPFHAGAQRTAEGYRYAFRIESGDDDGPTRGVTYALGDRSRIELLDERGRASRGYLLVTDGGRTLTSVDPDKREYSVTSADQFERIVGTAMQAVDRVMTLEVDDLDVTGRRLGAGGRVAGHETERSRLSAAFGLRIGALGFTTRQRHDVDVEYWVAPGLDLPRNPLIELFTGLPMVLAQADGDFTTRMRVGREALVGRGTPLRVVITAREVDDKGRHKEKRTTIEIAELTRGAQDPSRFQVPAGYVKRDGFNFSVRH
jgi:hypothetical protein